MAETDDGKLAAVYRIGGTPASALKRLEVLEVPGTFLSAGDFGKSSGGVRLGRQAAARCRRGGMADAIDLGSIARQGVEVRVLSSAPMNGE